MRLGALGPLLWVLAVTAPPQDVHAQAPPAALDGIYEALTDRQTEADEYTRYELLAPDSSSFRITYEVTVTTSGARYFYNPIRKGSVASDEHVYDAMSGEALQFEVVSGVEARKDALLTDADADTDYIKVQLARPVPSHGQGRIVIVKTYRDAKSYYLNGSTLVFDRPLGIKRNKVVLPAGYEVVGLTLPAQIRTEADGRLSVSFMHLGSGDAPLQILAVKDAQQGDGALPHPVTDKRSWESPFQGEGEQSRLAERAHQDRSIVYFLQQPQTHAFTLYHDYTETRPGINAYANVVRAGSVASHPSAIILDTGEELQTREMSGAQMKAARLNVGERVPSGAHVVVVPFEAITPNRGIRLRITETYTAPISYRLDGDEAIFDRSLGRPRNAVVLPSGWYCTFNAVPATVTQLPDGRVRFDYWDDRPEAAVVLLKAKRRLEQQ